MIATQTMRIIGLMLAATITLVSASKWIDPHDMNTNAKEKYVKQTLKKSQSTSSVNVGIADPWPDICHSHLRRIVSILVKSAHIDKRNSESYHGHIRFNIEPSHFDFLNDFGKGVVTLEKLRQLDTILSDSFKRTFVDEYLDTIESFWVQLYSLTTKVENLFILGGVFLLYVIYQQFQYGFSFFYVLKYLLIIVITVDFGIRYQYLLQEAEEHNIGVLYSKECDTNQMSWADWTKFILSNRNCEKKIVTPLDAFLYQIKHLIIVPMHAFGTGLGGFGYNLFRDLPWGLNLIMWAFMLVFTLVLLLFLLTICTGQSIEFNFFHMLKMRFGGRDRERNLLSGPTVEKLLDKVLHRPMVQNVNISVPTTDGTKESGPCPQICSPTEISTIEPSTIEPSTSDNAQEIVDDSKLIKSPSSDKSTNTCFQIRNAKTSLGPAAKSEEANSTIDK